MKNRFTLAQVIRAVRWTGAALIVAYMAFSMFLIISLAGSETDQDKVLNLIIADNDSDACRDRIEQEFLGLVGTLIILSEDGTIDQISIDRLTNSVDRLDQIDLVCPQPVRPGD